MEKLTENYLKKNHRNQINERILCLKDYVSSVGDTINKATITTTKYFKKLFTLLMIFFHVFTTYFVF